MAPDSEDILKRGFIDVRVKASGVIQLHRFEVVREKTGFGEVPFLVCPGGIPQAELIRIADQTQLPVKSGAMASFPKGKMAKDFAGR